MSTRLKSFTIVKPIPGEAVPNYTKFSMRARLRNRFHSMLIKNFKASGITLEELAMRTGYELHQIRRLIGSPGSMKIDTLSDLLFAMNSAEPVANLNFPLDSDNRVEDHV